MNTNKPRESDPSEEIDLTITEELRATPELVFTRTLRGELRGRQARHTRSLRWFDIELPVNTIRVVHDDELVHLVTNDLPHFDERANDTLGFEPRFGESKRVRAASEAVLAGRRTASEVVFLAELTPFQRSVLTATATIPRGAVRPYGWVAKEAGAPAAVRATGTALGHNPVPFLVPCHRVVRSDWSLGEYSAGGTAVKERVLEMEGFTAERLDWIRHAPRFVGQLNYMEFCLPVCDGLDQADPASLTGFASPADATGAGFAPCSWCKPI